MSKVLAEAVQVLADVGYDCTSVGCGCISVGGSCTGVGCGYISVGGSCTGVRDECPKCWRRSTGVGSEHL